jgi:hypothetical protein
MPRSPGQHIQVSFVDGPEVMLVMPVTVVADDPGLIMHYLAPGTRYLRRQAIDQRPPPRVIPHEEFGTVRTRFVVEEWRHTHRLIVSRPGQAHAVFLKWKAPSWEFVEWYVNLQAPLRRTEVGFVTEDHYLDIRVRPDRSWSWKDEDELDLAVSLGRISPDAAREIRREGERAIVDIEAGRFPFDDSLLSWRPDGTWPIPDLPAFGK